MADLFEIELADGIPVQGDGTVKTINALMEDGALATIGSRTDPASAATDATPATEIALLKMLSSLLQSLRSDWPDALGPGGGLKVEGSGQPLAVSGNVTITQVAGTVSVASFTCGTTAYLANDVVGASSGAGSVQFTAVAPGAAAVQIMSLSLEIDRAAIISGETTYRLHLYSVAPPSGLADSAPWDLVAGDRASYLGYIDIPTPNDMGSTLYIEVNNINKIVKTVSAQLYGYLVSIGPYTPTAAFHKLVMGSRLV